MKNQIVIAILGLALGAGACTNKQSESVVFVSVTATSDMPAVTQLRATLVGAGISDVEYFPQVNSPTPISFTPAATFSLVIPRSHSGDLNVLIDALDAESHAVGQGQGTVRLSVGGRADTAIVLYRVQPGLGGAGGNGGAGGAMTVSTSSGPVGPGGIVASGGTTITGGALGAAGTTGEGRTSGSGGTTGTGGTFGIGGSAEAGRTGGGVGGLKTGGATTTASTNTSATGRVLPQNGFTIAWMSNGTTSSYLNSSRNGAIAAGQALTSKFHVNVNVSIMDPEENVSVTQASRVQAAVANPSVLGLAIDVINPDILNSEIDKAVAAGVTVMTFDSDAPASKRASYYGMDNRATGVAAAKILATLMGKPGGIAIMNKENPPTAANFVARREGFIAELANHPGFTVVVDLPCNDGATGESTTKAGCAGVLEETMAAYPQVTGWFLSRGRPLRQADMGKDAPNWTAKVKAGTFFAVSYDATVEAVPNIRAGYVNAVINQKYYGWGYDVVSLLYDVIANKRSILPFTDSGFDVVCANNVEEVATAWSKNDFSRPISKCQLGSSQWP